MSMLSAPIVPPALRAFQEEFSYDRSSSSALSRSPHKSCVPFSADNTLPYNASPYSAPQWSTLRFRRAKDHKGWVLLGIPLSLYPLVVQRLFEHQAKFISKHRNGVFISLLFEAPQTLAATLAITFPAPPGGEPLVINEKGDRILSGSSTRSTKARCQLVAN